MINPITEYKRWQWIHREIEKMCINNPENEEIKVHLENASKELARLSVEVSNLVDDEAILETDTD